MNTDFIDVQLGLHRIWCIQIRPGRDLELQIRLGPGPNVFMSCGPTWHKQQWNTRINTMLSTRNLPSNQLAKFQITEHCY